MQVKTLDRLLEDISQDTFWTILPKVLGVDARLTLMVEVIQFEEFSNEELSV